jgi:tetratricopeptide (TPR) repeat protein
MKNEWRVLVGVCVVVVGIYAYTAHSGYFVSSSLSPADEYYNLLVQGFRAGHLNVEADVPPALARLANPYDATAHAPYPVLDMSYYKGKLYLYFGATPALVLFWPYVALTGSYLPQKDAGVLFCFVGFLATAGLLFAFWRRYFAEISVTIIGAGALALGLATCTPLLLARCDIHEVSISCGYAFTMLALAGIWKALTEPQRQGWWLAAASLAYGLAVAARPLLLFGAVILLVPVARAWRERRNIWVPLLAASGPIMLIGLGLMLYNVQRFDNPFEFGFRYQMAGDQQIPQQYFSLRYLWFNFRVYFLEPARWSTRFPFAHEAAVPPLPNGYARAETPFGVLTNIPLVWLALAAPLAWRNRSASAGSVLGWFTLAVALLFAASVVSLCLFRGSASRYELDFLPALVLLAVVGMLGLERALSDQVNRRRTARWAWGVLLGLSVGFNLFASVERVGEAHNYRGYIFSRTGQTQEAIDQYEQALRLKPDYAEAHDNLGVALEKMGKIQEAIGHYEQAVLIRPDYPEAHYNLGVASERVGRAAEAIDQYEQALRLKPAFTEARYNLAVALQRAGRAPEAIGQYEQLLRLKPDYAEAHNNLGVVLFGQGRLQEAIKCYEEALRLKPEYAEAHYNLGLVLLQLGKTDETIRHWEQAVQIKPDYLEAHYNLGVALEKSGRTTEAIEHYQQALKLRPDFAGASNALVRLGVGQ